MQNLKINDMMGKSNTAEQTIMDIQNSISKAFDK